VPCVVGFVSWGPVPIDKERAQRMNPEGSMISIRSLLTIQQAALESCHLPDCIPIFDSEHEAVRQEAYC